VVTRLLRATLAVAERVSLAAAVALADDRTRALVGALFPSDAEWSQFMADPDSFPLHWVQVTE
jgi:hypothetical protein